MTKEEFILNAAAQMAGPMLAARDEDGVNIYSEHDVRDRAIRLGKLMCKAHVIDEWIYYAISEAVKDAIVIAKTLDHDNDYGTRRGNLDKLLDKLTIIADRLDIMDGHVSQESLTNVAEEDFKKLMELYDEGLLDEP